MSVWVSRGPLDIRYGKTGEKEEFGRVDNASHWVSEVIFRVSFNRNFFGDLPKSLFVKFLLGWRVFQDIKADHYRVVYSQIELYTLNIRVVTTSVKEDGVIVMLKYVLLRKTVRKRICAFALVTGLSSNGRVRGLGSLVV